MEQLKKDALEMIWSGLTQLQNATTRKFDAIGEWSELDIDTLYAEIENAVENLLTEQEELAEQEEAEVERQSREAEEEEEEREREWRRSR